MTVPFIFADRRDTIQLAELDANFAAVDGTAGLTAHIADHANPHVVTKAQVGLGNADNTSDINKPISTATQTALDAKATSSSVSAHIADTAAHGVTGAVVGTTNSQTLTNKTVNLASNTLTGTAAQFNAAVSDADFVTSGGALGTPSSGTLTNCTFPTLNQNTTGTAAGLSATLAVGSGGTGLTAAGASGNVLTSNGSAWASAAPTNVGLGISQTWQDMTASRALSTDYTNSTGAPIMLSVCYSLTTSGAIAILINGVEMAYAQGENVASIKRTLCIVVPNGAVYRVNPTNSPTISYWRELR